MKTKTVFTLAPQPNRTADHPADLLQRFAAAICCMSNRRSTRDGLSEKLATDPDLSEKLAISLIEWTG